MIRKPYVLMAPADRAGGSQYSFHKAPPLAIERLTDVIRVLQPSEHTCTEDAAVTGFTTDSRAVAPGQIYVAVEGQRVDGHRFTAEAAKRGAIACLVRSLDKAEPNRNCIAVGDTIRALGFLAAAHRRAMKTKILGITGSVGKTTTKEITASVLNTTFHTRKSEGNYNSTIGLPMEILKLKPEDEWMVAEMGMSYPGEIRQLMEIAQPDAALWTTVHAVHMANFASLEEIAKAKAEIVDYLGKDKILIYNADDPLVSRFSAPFRGKKFTYGFFDPQTDVRARMEPFSDWDATPFHLEFGNGKHQLLSLPLPGRFNVNNAVAACAAGLALGVSGSDLVSALRCIQPSAQRSKLYAYDGDVLVVDDTYNASPVAVENVLRSFAPLSPRYYRWLILGDMLELGDEEHDIHRKLGESIAGYGFDQVTLIGTLSEFTYEGLMAHKRPNCKVEHFPSVNEAAAALSGPIPEGSRIWCKASRGIRLERFVQALTAKLA